MTKILMKRSSCRAIILSPSNEILLIQITNPNSNWLGWIAPGGGVENNEDEKIALLRELNEELGFIPNDIGNKIWIRRHVFPWQGCIIEQTEYFFLVLADKFNPTPNQNADDIDNLKIFKWWTIEELKESKDNFAPKNLSHHLELLIKNGPPSSPVDVGV